jgi:geranylgeranyl pyrophosphate synthase
VVSHLPKVKVGENFGASMLRPTLVMLGYETAGGAKPGEIVSLAAAVELLNMSTYVIDDMFDNCGMRHSEVTVHVKYGNNNAIIAGFILRELAGKALGEMEWLSAERRTELHEMLTKTHYVIYAGQYHDLELNTRKDVEMGEYMERTSKITGEFIQNCIIMGAIAAGADEKTLERLREFGRNYGTAIQIRNDLMDFVVPDDRIENSKGFKGITHTDFKEGKKTLPVIHALKNGSEAQRKQLLSLLGKRDAADEELLAANKLMEALGSFEHTKGVIIEYRKRAMDSLEGLADNEGKRGLLELARILDNVEKWKFS